MYHTLQLVLILLAAAVLIVVLFRFLRLPPLLGYLVIGAALSPHAFGLLPDTEETHTFAEIGVVFLMFSIGLEFSLPRLSTMKYLVFGLGSLQVGLTMALVVAVAVAWGMDWRAGIALGGVLAMSSTAIVGKMLEERFEINSQHGRQIMGVLLFQDLAVVPLLIIIPALSAPPESLALLLAGALVEALAIFALLFYFGQRLLRPWFHLVARQKSSELFVLNVLFVTLGMAYLTGAAGLTLALGAFLAGALISETEYRYQVEADIRPFRDVLLGLFFVTIGMQLDFKIVAGNIGWIVLLLVALIGFKGLLIAGLSRGFEATPSVAFRVGASLSQGGEFGFVLLALAAGTQVLNTEVAQIVLASMVLSMLVAPFIIEHSEHLARHVSGADWLNQAAALHKIAVQTMTVDAHVIICGYGRCGQNLTRFLDQEGISWVALDLDPTRIRDAVAGGENVVYGDASRREVLIAAGLSRARALIVTYVDVPSALQVLNHTQQMRPELPVVVRTRDDANVAQLKDAGAAEVVAEIPEGSLMLASTALMLLGVPFTRVLQYIRDTRESRYHLFQGFFRGTTEDAVGRAAEFEPRLHSIVIPEGAAAIGKTLRELNLESRGVGVTAVRRRNVRGLDPSPETLLETGDVLVLQGSEQDLFAAEMQLMQG
jgi:monovalent cation:H+ antiporter-2, CPA2 family